MNAYLRLKFRPEQQILNDYDKLMTAKEYNTKKMLTILQELIAYYVNYPLMKDRISPPMPIFTHFWTHLSQLKDKKDDLRATRYLYYLISQCVANLTGICNDETGDPKTPIMKTEKSETSEQHTIILEQRKQMLSQLLHVLETSEVHHVNAPRQALGIKLISWIYKLLDHQDYFVRLSKHFIQNSPIWAKIFTSMEVSKKRLAMAPLAALTSGSKKDTSAQLIQLSAVFHGLRFHALGDPDQWSVDMLEYLIQAIFLSSKTLARHASQLYLRIFQTSSQVVKGRVIFTLDKYLAKFKPKSLYLPCMDTLGTTYFLNLIGAICRMPVQIATEVLGPNDPVPMDVISSGTIPHTFAQKLRSMLLDLIIPVPITTMIVASSASYYKQLTSPPQSNVNVPVPIILLAIEQIMQLPDPSIDITEYKEFLLQPTRGYSDILDLATSTLLSYVQAPEHAKDTLLFHRILKTIASVGKCLNNVEVVSNSGKVLTLIRNKVIIPVPSMIAISEVLPIHLKTKNPYTIACVLRAIIWSYPRSRIEGDKVIPLLKLLKLLPIDYIATSYCKEIAEIFYYRATSIHISSLDTSMGDCSEFDTNFLLLCLETTVYWYTYVPCAWHGTIILKCLECLLAQEQHGTVSFNKNIFNESNKQCDTLGNIVFSSISTVLNHLPPPKPTEGRIIAQLIRQETLIFLSSEKTAQVLIVKYSGKWFFPLWHCLTRFIMLEDERTKRFSIEVVAIFNQFAVAVENKNVYQYTKELLNYLEQQNEIIFNPPHSCFLPEQQRDGIVNK